MEKSASPARLCLRVGQLNRLVSMTMPTAVNLLAATVVQVATAEALVVTVVLAGIAEALVETAVQVVVASPAGINAPALTSKHLR
jgi:hypothetical protein